MNCPWCHGAARPSGSIVCPKCRGDEKRKRRGALEVKIGQIWSRPALPGDFSTLPITKGLRKRFIIVDVGTKYAVVRNEADSKRHPTRGIKLSALLARSDYKLEWSPR